MHICLYHCQLMEMVDPPWTNWHWRVMNFFVCLFVVNVIDTCWQMQRNKQQASEAFFYTSCGFCNAYGPYCCISLSSSCLYMPTTCQLTVIPVSSSFLAAGPYLLLYLRSLSSHPLLPHVLPFTFVFQLISSSFSCNIFPSSVPSALVVSLTLSNSKTWNFSNCLTEGRQPA